MRTKQAFKNALMSLLLQVALALSGLIVPRFFIALYGSPMNGLVSSINQFISYMGLVEAGVSAAGTVALYRPIADKDTQRINQILSAAKEFYRRSGMIFAALVAALVLGYPYVVKNQIQDMGFIRMMILVLSVNGLVDYFYLGKYRIFLMANQRGYVISFIQIIGTVVMTALSVGLMTLECSALLVKLSAAAVYLMRSLAVGIYVRKNYPQVHFRETPDRTAFSQRWSALLHQIVNMVVNNTDIILLTLLLPSSGLSEVSVYSVHNLVGYSLSSMMTSISNGLTSGFGEVISRGEKQVLCCSFSTYEYAFFMVIFVAYTCMAVLLHPFIQLYSASFTDGVVYLRWSLVALFTAAGLLQAVRLPGLTVILAAGHYRQTRTRAVAEAAINLGVSLLLIRPLGIVGVLLGTCLSYFYRTTDVILYSAKHFLSGSLKTTFFRLARNGACMAVLIWVGLRLVPSVMAGWSAWFGYAVAFGLCSVVAFLTINSIFERDAFLACCGRVREIIKRKG